MAPVADLITPHPAASDRSVAFPYSLYCGTACPVLIQTVIRLDSVYPRAHNAGRVLGGRLSQGIEAVDTVTKEISLAAAEGAVSGGPGSSSIALATAAAPLRRVHPADEWLTSNRNGHEPGAGRRTISGPVMVRMLAKAP